MAPYSLDLRRKVVEAYERGVGSQRQVAELFGVSLAFVEKLFKQLRETKQLAPKPHAGGRASRLDGRAQQQLQDWLRAAPDLTLVELVERLDKQLGIRIGISRLCIVLQALGLPRKKHSTRASLTKRR